MSDQTTGPGADVAVEIAGQKVNVRNVRSLNTAATLLTLALVLLLCYAFYQHMEDSRAAGKDFVHAVKEQTIAIREGTAAQREATCIQKFEERERARNADWCAQISGVARPR